VLWHALLRVTQPAPTPILELGPPPPFGRAPAGGRNSKQQAAHGNKQTNEKATRAGQVKVRAVSCKKQILI
jgi:hypothetical protein